MAKKEGAKQDASMGMNPPNTFSDPFLNEIDLTVSAYHGLIRYLSGVIEFDLAIKDIRLSDAIYCFEELIRKADSKQHCLVISNLSHKTWMEMEFAIQEFGLKFEENFPFSTSEFLYVGEDQLSLEMGDHHSDEDFLRASGNAS